MADHSDPDQYLKRGQKLKSIKDEGKRPTPKQVEHAFAGLGEELRTFDRRVQEAMKAFTSGVLEVLRQYDEGMRAAVQRMEESGGKPVAGSTTIPAANPTCSEEGHDHSGSSCQGPIPSGRPSEDDE